MLTAVCVFVSVSVVRPADADEIAFSPAELPVWHGRLAEAPPSSGCVACDAFASDEGFFSVAVDCLNRSIPSERRMKYFHDERWVSTQLGGCLASLISSLGTPRPASFFRQGLPAETTWSLPGVVVGRRSAAAVTGAYSFDANFWSTSRGGSLEEHPPCLNESFYAADRRKFTEMLCGSMDLDALQAVLGKSNLNCQFSGLDAMAQQFAAFNRDNGCERAWFHNQVILLLSLF